LTVSRAFTALALFNMLRGPLGAIPNQRIAYLQAHVSLERIETFFNEPEIPSAVAFTPTATQGEDKHVVGEAEHMALRNLTAAWPSSLPNAQDKLPDNAFKLSDIDVDFPDGTVTLITGQVRSGKTALLNAILGEMTIIDGLIYVRKNSQALDDMGNRRTISYAAQNPWLQSLTIRDNIWVDGVL
jgi:ABC-type multidrug transport system fused ATPase/permease subunit